MKLPDKRASAVLTGGRRPNSPGNPVMSAQEVVTAHFGKHVGFWREVYQGTDVFSGVHRHRQTLALAWIDDLALQVGARVLEVGAGAGFTSMALLRRGFAVTAVDVEEGMVQSARRLAREEGLEHGLRVGLADAHALPYADGSFDLAVALGVLPWLHNPVQALREMVRVLRPGGYLVLNVDNRDRLIHLLDPLYNTALHPVREAAKAILHAVRVRRSVRERPMVVTHSPVEFRGMLAAAGLELSRGSIFGFGPFTFLGRIVLPERVGMTVHLRLQRWAERGIPGLRWRGAQYLVVARKVATEGVRQEGGPA